jgi:hypothetical protein
VGLVVVLGLFLYLVKIMHSPVNFTIHDEFLDLRTANDIVRTGHLFHPNPLLPISALYPSMEMIASAIAVTTGLSLYVAGVIVVGAARLILVLGLYLFFKEVSKSTQVAGVGSLLYMTNPNFLFFGAMFKYESLALAFSALLLFLVALQTLRSESRSRGLAVAIACTLAVLVTTHHLTSYAVTGFLIVWAVLGSAVRRFGHKNASSPWPVALSGIVANAAWLLLVARTTIGYLSPHFSAALTELLGTVAEGKPIGRQLFSTNAGTVAPLWERVMGEGSVVVILLLLPVGLWILWKRFRWKAIVLALALTALAYPASLVLRFTNSGWEIANRSSEFVYLGLGFVLALGMGARRLVTRRQPLRNFALAGVAVIMLIGGLIDGWTPILRIPGPYIAAADARSVEPEGLSDASWMRSMLGFNNRIAADRTNALLMGSSGEQFPVSTLNGGVDISWLFYAPQLGPDQRALLRKGRIQYIVVDERLARDVPFNQPYDGNDPRASLYKTKPLAPELFAKFYRAAHLSLVFDSGNILVYQVGSKGAT